MFTEQATTKDGNTKTVMAADKKDLAEAVKAVENQSVAASTPDINVPVRKGHDLLAVDQDQNLVLVNGSGAHNSPREAVRDDGTLEGDPEVPFVVTDREANTLVGQKKLVKDAVLADVEGSDLEKDPIADAAKGEGIEKSPYDESNTSDESAQKTSDK